VTKRAEFVAKIHYLGKQWEVRVIKAGQYVPKDQELPVEKRLIRVKIWGLGVYTLGRMHHGMGHGAINKKAKVIGQILP
jgi:hypothetical protein